MVVNTVLLSNVILLYGSAIIFIIVAAIALKLFYSFSIRGKLKEYQSEIAKSHSKILKLEVTNEKLKQRVNELETIIQRPKIA